ncbi:MAG: rhomboid family intramembrane serine protease, partial [Paludibacteraceae bacterium]|nr:rhomboid family intramembrane serine protease [Paludibacteraceae bacterium]
NLMLMLLIGPVLEEKYGSKKMLLMIIITAITTGITHKLLFSSGLWGASGIVFMLIILISFTNLKSGKIPLTFILVLIVYFGKEFVTMTQTDNISQFAHIFGGICGGAYGFIINKNKITPIETTQITNTNN